MILDIHTHHAAPQPLGIIDVSQSDLGTFVPADGQLYSVGIHPWNTVDPVPEESWKRVEELLRLPCFAAVGEGEWTSRGVEECSSGSCRCSNAL